MKRFGLMAGVLTVGVLFSACSQAPAEVKGGLEPQFGTSQNDSASVIATDTQRGRIYLGGSSYDTGDSQGQVVFFRSYSRDGSLIWKIDAARTDIDTSVTDVVVDPVGNVYFSWNTSALDQEGNYSAKGFVSKYSPKGVRLFQKRLKNENLRGLASDASGNFYTTSDSDHVRKYSSSGKLVWDKVITDKDFTNASGAGDMYLGPGSIFDIEASADGSLYIVGAVGDEANAIFLKLRSKDGKIVASRNLGADYALEVKVSGNSVYVYSEIDGLGYNPVLSKLRPDGSEVWTRRGFSKAVEGGYLYESSSSLGVDAQGNAYLTGYFVDKNDDADLYIRKYTPSGKTAFNKRFRSPGTEAFGNGVAAIGTNEVYVVGATEREVDGKNLGGFDAFLFRLNAQGQIVWQR